MLILSAVGCFLLGLLTWSFGEYALHNWVGHQMKGRNHFSREHLAHHSKGHYFTPTSEKALVGSVTVGIVAVVTGFLFGWILGSSYALGLGVAYLAYEVVHRRIHTHAPMNAYGRWARKHHFFHHFGDARMNHGVTSPIWDMVFGTYVKPETIQVPAKLATVWMVDPATQQIRKEHAQDYVLRGAQKS